MTGFFLALLIVSVADVITSKIGRDKGLEEANPLFAKPVVALMVNAIALAVMGIWNPSNAIWYAVIGIRAAIVANNIRLIKKGGR